jgi:hypothetical protein
VGAVLTTASPAAAAGARRPSSAERERVARRLRAASADERLSVETFAGRLELAYTARTRAELDRLVEDLPQSQPVGRAALAATVWLSGWAARLGEAWQRTRAQELVLPRRERTLLGRSRECDVPLPAPAVSSRHALLAYRDGRWTVADLGSLNGTFVNGRRIVDAVAVRPGDELRLADLRFRLAAPHDLSPS